MAAAESDHEWDPSSDHAAAAPKRDATVVAGGGADADADAPPRRKRRRKPTQPHGAAEPLQPVAVASAPAEAPEAPEPPESEGPLAGLPKFYMHAWTMGLAPLLRPGRDLVLVPTLRAITDTPAVRSYHRLAYDALGSQIGDKVLYLCAADDDDAGGNNDAAGGDSGQTAAGNDHATDTGDDHAEAPRQARDRRK
jgi:hypothetical protein